jgi:hypothetical protein
MLIGSDGRPDSDIILIQEWSKCFEIIEAGFCKDTDIKGANAMRFQTHL